MKEKVRITQAFVNKANRFKDKHTRSRILCAKFLYREEIAPGEYVFRLYVRAKILVYLLILVPALLAGFFYCLWDGGLKSFRWPSPVMMNRRIDSTYPEDYLNCLNEWERRKK